MCVKQHTACSADGFDISTRMQRHNTQPSLWSVLLIKCTAMFPIRALIDICPRCCMAVLVPGSHMLIFTYIFTLVGECEQAFCLIHADNLAVLIY